MKIVLYQITENDYQLIEDDLPCEVVVVNNTHLNTTVEEVFKLNGLSFSLGETFALYQGLSQNQIIDFVTKTKNKHSMIHATYTTTNASWTLQALVDELKREHALMRRYEVLGQCITRLNDKMANLTQDEKQVLLEAYMQYENQETDLDVLDHTIERLNYMMKGKVYEV